ncbi:TRAP transporter substrate-binding protein [Virgibacillus sp. NKC19-3]|uniref:TRAP transporter substrate-binding protein n=1 Tax=Virgibacillus saliphilus TaxID=2831674 RepID=UPI001C9B8962|nr:TRAP transporter substrate-binding protein [Virgibacillus sp. NKC19-3]MBY7142302.1 TRAP transporter substrate-binding protein [Virgibacillus sp. NKC19-3]
MKRKALSLIVMSLFILFLVACSSNSSGDGDSSDGGTTTLTLAEDQPEDFPTTIGDKEFARLVEEKTDGRYEIEVYPDGQLTDEKSSIEQLQLGSLDFARVNGSPLTEFNDNIGALSMPFLFESEEEKWDVWEGEVGQEILDSFTEDNLIGLAYYDNGERFFYTAGEPVTTLEDIKGKKIRVQESDLAIDIAESLGASATPMSYDEVYSAIQTGVIDGAENNFPSYQASGHYEVAEYASLPGYQDVPEVLLGSKQVWDDLSEEDQQLFKEAAEESVDAQREAWDELVDKSRDEIEENGNEIVEMDDIEEWREAVQPVYDKYEDQYGEWLDRIQDEQ